MIFETAFEEWVERRRPSQEQQQRVLGFLADVADGTVTLDQLVQVPHSAAFQAQLTVDDVFVLVELLRGDADWCVVSYIGAGLPPSGLAELVGVAADVVAVTRLAEHPSTRVVEDPPFVHRPVETLDETCRGSEEIVGNGEGTVGEPFAIGPHGSRHEFRILRKVRRDGRSDPIAVTLE